MKFVLGFIQILIDRVLNLKNRCVLKVPDEQNCTEQQGAEQTKAVSVEVEAKKNKFNVV